MSDISLPEDLRELTLAELDEVVGSAAAVGSEISVSFALSATGPNASVSFSQSIFTATPSTTAWCASATSTTATWSAFT